MSCESSPNRPTSCGQNPSSLVDLAASREKDSNQKTSRFSAKQSKSGLLIIDKPAGFTSHQVVSRVRKLFATRKVGHAGTLDPMATGVLVLGINQGTKLLGHLALHDKRYLARIRLGSSTVTDDAEGEVLDRQDASKIDETMVSKVISEQFMGQIWQVPSQVSAIKIDGKRAYTKVRAGEDFKLAPRQVNISRFNILGSRRVESFFDLDVDVECSSGTYIRALARDIGEFFGVGGHLTALRRTRVGPYRIEDAQILPDATENKVSLNSVECPDLVRSGSSSGVETKNHRTTGLDLSLMSMADAAARSLATVQASSDQIQDISYGRPIDLQIPADPTGILTPDGYLAALYRPSKDGRSAVAVSVFISPSEVN